MKRYILSHEDREHLWNNYRFLYCVSYDLLVLRQFNIDWVVIGEGLPALEAAEREAPDDPALARLRLQMITDKILGA